ncbi:hypothetical protein LOC68_12125 [Blastopirellula sp. JC732]|uniref:Uncharacterized protein n=1 Tax=Blastopirellula sediminis TaxID=2894196 RepID=A0A9X1MM65_9BACT|nr:hypothetical protein [Blastopirellula sediminis]MCC9607561.1 hypothetical protein [Blastopirellula sediminis]MCC9629146.1 hypothetical protein [Blastopirellula sediminis]
MAESQSESEHVESSPAAAPRRNWLAAVGKIALYSFLLLSAGTLFAAQYVPEVANALSFLLPEEEPHSCCSQRSNPCPSTMTADYASYSDGASCCPSSSGCPASGGCPNEMLVTEVDSTPETDPQLAKADNPPIPPVVD